MNEQLPGDGLLRVFRAYGGHDCFTGCKWDNPDCRPDSGGFHGIGSLKLYFAVAVPGRGAVSLELLTPMYPASVHGRWEAKGSQPPYHPLGVVDLHYADPPEYLTEYGPKDCDLIGGQCWTDCTYLAAHTGYDMLLNGGEKAVWSWLAETYLPDAMGYPAAMATGENA